METQTDLILAVIKLRKEKGAYEGIAREIGISHRRLFELVKAAKAGRKVRMHRLTEDAFRRYVK